MATSPPTSNAGRLVASSLIIFGVGMVGYVAGFMTSLLEDSDRSEISALRQGNARLEADMQPLLAHLNIPLRLRQRVSSN